MRPMNYLLSTTACLFALQGCVSTSTYNNIQIEGTTFVVEPREVAANGLEAIDVTLVLRGGPKQLPLQNIPLEMTAGTASVLTPMTKTNEQGEAFSRLISNEVGTHFIQVEAKIGNQSVVLAKDEVITFRDPSSIDLLPNTVGQPGSFRLSVPQSSRYPINIGFRSTDPLAQLPPSYTIASERDIYHVFVGQLIFRTAGRQVLTSYNLADDTIIDTQEFMIEPGEASMLSWQSARQQMVAGETITGTITVQDSYGNLATNYRGTIAFASHQEPNNLPQPITWTQDDQGEKSVTISRFFAAQQTISLQDIDNRLLTTSFQLLITPFQAMQLMFLNPVQATGCQNIPDVQVAVTDAYGNITPANDVLITLTSINQSLTGTTQVMTEQGIATFDGIRLMNLSTSEQLMASAPAMTNTPSNVFPVTIDPPQVRIDNVVGLGGCVAIQYTVSQACSLPVDLYVDFQFPEQNFRAASGTRSQQGIYKLPTSQQGNAYTFVWNSTKDLPRKFTTDLTLRIQANVQDVKGPATERRNVTIDNTVQFNQSVSTANIAPGTALASGLLNVDMRSDVVFFRDQQLHVFLTDSNNRFLAETTLSMTQQVQSLILHDFNHDSKADLMVHPQNANQLLIYWGLGTGQFENVPLSLPMPGIALIAPQWIDINQDSFDDLIVPVGQQLLIFNNTRNKMFSSTSLATMDTIESLTTGDIDRNGSTDILVNLASGQLQWLINQQGTLTAQAAFDPPLQEHLGKIVLKDIDRNGWLDLVAQPRQGQGLLSQLRLGANEFAQALLLDLPYRPDQWELIDVDLNGQSDVFIQAIHETPMWRTWIGDGQSNGWHQLPTSLSSSVLHFTDINSDGYHDIIGFVDGQMVVHINQLTAAACSEGFRGSELVACVSGQVRQGDINKDGTLDLVVQCDFEPWFWMHMPLSGGEYVYFPGYGGYNFSYPGTLSNAFLEDFDLDGQLDVVFISHSLQQHKVSSLPNNVFTYSTNPSRPPTHTDATPIDFNHDGYLDMAYSDDQNNRIAFYSNNHQGVFGSPSFLPVPPGSGPLEVADLNRDGFSDLIVVHPTSSMITLWLGQSNGQFLSLGEPIITPSFPQEVLMTDSNNDGEVDMLVYCDISRQLVQFLNDGTGHLLPFYSYRLQGTMGGMTAGDINSDGYIDIVTTYPGSAETEIWWGRSFGVFDQTFAVFLDSDSFATNPLIVDLNNDRMLDVGVGADNFNIYFNQGNNQFSELYTTNAAPSCNTIHGADYSGDGHIDVVTGCIGNRSIGLYTGNGKGQLNRKPMLFTNYDAEEILSADMNRDQVHDIVIRHSNPDGISIMHFNRSQQTFVASQTINTPFAINHMAVEDVNFDGYNDVLALSAPGQRIYTYLGSASGLVLTYTRTTTDSPTTMALADFNLDGYPDILTGSDRVRYSLNAGNGSFGAFVTIYNFGNLINNVATIDWNRDGYQDVVASPFADGSHIIYGRPNTTFSSTPTQLPLSYHMELNGPTRTMGTPLELGGPEQLFSWMPEEKYTVTWLNKNGKTFHRGTGIISEFGVFFADMDEDGALDLLTVSNRVSPSRSQVIISKQWR